MKKLILLLMAVFTFHVNSDAQEISESFKNVIRGMNDTELRQEVSIMERQIRDSQSSLSRMSNSKADAFVKGITKEYIKVQKAHLEYVKKQIAGREAAQRTGMLNATATNAAMQMAHFNKTEGTTIMMYEAEMSRERNMAEMDERIAGMENLKVTPTRRVSTISRQDMSTFLEGEETAEQTIGQYALKKFQKSNRIIWDYAKSKAKGVFKFAGKIAIASKTTAPMQVRQALDNAEAIVDAEMDIAKEVTSAIVKTVETEDPRYLEIAIDRAKSALLQMYAKVAFDCKIFGIPVDDMWDSLYRLLGLEIDEE